MDPQTTDLIPDRDAARCLICLHTFSGQPVATPQQCGHLYCLTCITEWAKTTNSCPVDRLEFHFICQRSHAGGDVEKIVKVEPRQRQGSDEDVIVLSVCEECGRSDRRRLMLLCAMCDTRYHIGCLSPPLNTVPYEDWLCQECAVEDSHTNEGFSKEESEVDEGEIMDLLADAVPTSSRLRPSTHRRSTVTANARRSERVHRQGSQRHASHSQASQHVPKYLLRSSGSDEEDGTTSCLLLDIEKSAKQAAKKRKRR